MSDEGVCRRAPATPGLIILLLKVHRKEGTYIEKMPMCPIEVS